MQIIDRIIVNGREYLLNEKGCKYRVHAEPNRTAQSGNVYIESGELPDELPLYAVTGYSIAWKRVGDGEYKLVIVCDTNPETAWFQELRGVYQPIEM